MNTIGERLKYARKKAGLSQAKLAEKAGIKQASVSELERGLSRSSGYIVQLAKACGVSPEWLAGGKEASEEGWTTTTMACSAKPSVDPDNVIFYALGEDLLELRKKAKLSRREVAEKLGVSPSKLFRWEAGVTLPPDDVIEQLAEIYGISSSELICGDTIKEGAALYSNIEAAAKLGGMAPLISWVQAGAFAETHVEYSDDMEYYPRPANASDQTFVLRVVGESMIDEYKPGTLIFVDPERPAVSGDDVVAAMEGTGEATFKRYIEDPGAGKMLKALNSAWPNQFIQINGNCQIIGVVVADMRIR